MKINWGSKAHYSVGEKNDCIQFFWMVTCWKQTWPGWFLWTKLKFVWMKCHPVIFFFFSIFRYPRRLGTFPVTYFEELKYDLFKGLHFWTRFKLWKISIIARKLSSSSLLLGRRTYYSSQQKVGNYIVILLFFTCWMYFFGTMWVRFFLWPLFFSFLISSHLIE